MKLKYVLAVCAVMIIGIFLILRYESKEHITPINRFIRNEKIDTLQYKTWEQLEQEGKVTKIWYTEPILFSALLDKVTLDAILPKYDTLNNTIVFMKYNKDGFASDSLVLPKDFQEIDKYLTNGKQYTSWLLNGNKTLHPVIQIQGDSINLKKTAERITAKRLPYKAISELRDYTDAEYDSISKLNEKSEGATTFVTEPVFSKNYLVFSEGGKIYGLNLVKNNLNIYDYLKISDQIERKTPNNYMDFAVYLTADSFAEIDNFFAKTKTNVASRGLSLNINNRYVLGDYYTGTEFKTLKVGNHILKIKKHTLREIDHRSAVPNTINNPEAKLGYIMISTGERTETGMGAYYLIRKK